MGTLSSELTHARVDAVGGAPRIYADANIPTRHRRLHAARSSGGTSCSSSSTTTCGGRRDIEHYRLARQLGRTLVTLDRDYIDDRGFPPSEGAGVIVFWAPDEARLRELLARADRSLFRAEGAGPLPLDGRKLHWPHDGEPGDRRTAGRSAP